MSSFLFVHKECIFSFHCSVEEVTIPEFLSSVQDLVSSNLTLLSEEDEKKGKQGKFIARKPSPLPSIMFNFNHPDNPSVTIYFAVRKMSDLLN